MYIKKLTIRNFRCFEETELEPTYPGRRASKNRPVPARLKNVNLLLGGNGTGKSSVFRALALSVLAPVIRDSGFNADYSVHRKSGENGSSSPVNGLKLESAEVKAFLELHEADSEVTPHGSGSREIAPGVIGQVIIQRKGDRDSIVSAAHTNAPRWDRIFYNDTPAFFLVGYGSGRRTERPEGYSESSRAPRYQRVATLFEEHVGLVPFNYGYLQLKDRGHLEEARNLLNALLSEGVFLTDRVDGQNQLLFESKGVLLPFSALSDGYRAFGGWVWDLLLQMSRVMQASGLEQKFADIRGVVIIDEIDLFLHPEWQRTVIEQVAGTFPLLQFFFSSHSPLVAGTLHPENIFVLEDGKVSQYQESIYGLTANQVLTSSYFGLRSTRAPLTGTLNGKAKRYFESRDSLVEAQEAEPRDKALEAVERVRRMREETSAL